MVFFFKNTKYENKSTELFIVLVNGLLVVSVGFLNFYFNVENKLKQWLKNVYD